MQTVTISTKYQVVIPKKVREDSIYNQEKNYVFFITKIVWNLCL